MDNDPNIRGHDVMNAVCVFSWSAFWVVTLYSMARSQRFGETHHHLQNHRLSDTGNQQKLMVSRDPEDGDGTFFISVRFSWDYVVLQLKRLYSSESMS